MCDNETELGALVSEQSAGRICSLLMAVLGSILSLPAAALDTSVNEPAVVFHQYSYDKFSSEYIIRAYKNGTVIFTGKKNVRTLGDPKFRVSQEQVEAAVNSLNQLRIIEDNSPNQKIGPDNKRISFLEMRVGGEIKSATFFSRSLPSAYGRMRDVIEDAFPTRSLRCPYHAGSEDPSRPSAAPGRSVDVCNYMDGARRRAMSSEDQNNADS